MFLIHAGIAPRRSPVRVRLAPSKVARPNPLTFAGRGSLLGAAASAAVPFVHLVVIVEGGDLGEGRPELMAVDLFGVDGEGLQEGLVEESPLGGSASR
jgi:hypothetical protein